MNLPFAAWIAVRARRVAPIWVMFDQEEQREAAESNHGDLTRRFDLNEAS